MAAGIQALLTNVVSAPATGEAKENNTPLAGGRSFTGKVDGTGAVTATIVFEGANTNGVDAFWVNLATMTLSGTDSDVDGFVAPITWPYVRARVTAISGTGAAVNAQMGG